jgi:hypothetical protein
LVCVGQAQFAKNIGVALSKPQRPETVTTQQLAKFLAAAMAAACARPEEEIPFGAAGGGGGGVAPLSQHSDADGVSKVLLRRFTAADGNDVGGHSEFLAYFKFMSIAQVQNNRPTALSMSFHPTSAVAAGV